VLGVWFHRTSGDPQFRSGPFQPPQAPASGAAAPDQQLQAELQQLRQAGWEADSHKMRPLAVARSEMNRNLAIAEWPTASGTGYSASPTRPRRSRSSIARRSTTTSCSSGVWAA
jgi:hypothetical protein